MRITLPCHGAAVPPRCLVERSRRRSVTALVAVALMPGTGPRVGEVATLRCDDLDSDAKSARVIGKGSRERQVYLSSDWIVGLIRVQLKTRCRLGARHRCLLRNCQWPVGSAQWRTAELPVGGQQNCPFVANRTARSWPTDLPVVQLVSGVTPFPAVAWVRRMLSPAVMTMWAWCRSRSTDDLFLRKTRRLAEK